MNHSLKYLALAATTMLFLGFGNMAWAACTSSDFDVQDLDISVENCSGRNCPRLVMRGQLVNNCSEPAGARVEIEARAGNGNPVDSVDGWPARTENLGPGESAEFDFTAMMEFERNMSDFSVSIIETRTW
ncbi:hypothetical protein VCB98_00155 [Gammaproteobacteria bacterium AB-CW1]|uniref:Secreted protein n=1 Tax=Natronospira elongata TaxID=3110268 RepID=A0AAP6JCE2_9GAMM|nr:hypothetical protein [Gammaproteobacteria bacterium AB-CW1]